MRIAVLEDDPLQRAHIVHALSQQLDMPEECVSISAFDEGEALRRALRLETFDLLVLDWAVPDLDGIDLLRWLRDYKNDLTPVLMLSSFGSEHKIAEALDHGANDYVIKPYRAIELCARVRRFLKRPPDVGQSADAGRADAAQERFGAWLFNRGLLTVEVTSTTGEVPQIFRLTDREFRIALTLFRHMGQPVSRAYLLEQSSHDGETLSSRWLDNHMYRLRCKLGLNPSNGMKLQTVYGVGYRLESVHSDGSKFEA